ncbi:MAG: two-component system, NtrC family, sensor histidine kinase HydH [Thermodesulfobacterium sp.]|nr:two-component system, NtrC family, sensor histidine kinase HydH [Thermodesulfobacterium sp.]
MLIRKDFLSPFYKLLRSFSIKSRIFLSFLFLITLLLFSVNFLIINYQKNSLKNQYYEGLTHNLENFSLEVVDWLVFFDPLKLEEKVSSLKNLPGIVYVMVVDKNGRIVAHTNPSKLGQFIPVNDSTFKTWDNLDNNGIKHFNRPVFKEDFSLGAVRIGVSEADINDFIEHSINTLKRYMLFISGVFLLVALVVAYFISITLTKPLNKLKKSIQKVQANKFEFCENEKLILCKDFYQCKDYRCPSYGKTRCWLNEDSKKWCKSVLKIECEDCFVYKYSCGDELGYVIESFNKMVADLRSYMEQLDKATKEKIKLEKYSAVSEMAMVVAHEIKNPLNSIKAACSYLKTNFKGKVLQEFLSIIDKETQRLNELITGFLTYARPVPLKLEKTQINNIIKEIINLVKPEFEEEGKQIELSLDPSIPEFYFDPYQLKQVMLNLLVNAGDATKKGDKISVATQREGGFVVISVKDTGEGIPEELLDKVFEPFFTTKVTGSGLGLACVEKIVREHGGKVSVFSKKGEGTEFKVFLPIRYEI